MKPEEIFSRDPQVVSGELVFAGTRVPVRNLIDYLAGGDTLDDFLEAIPTVSREQAGGFLEWALEAARREAGAGPRPKRAENPADARTTGDALSPEDRVRARALEFFEGNVRAADRWLSDPRPVLGGATPLEMARTEAGARKVENLITGLEWGVFF